MKPRLALLLFLLLASGLFAAEIDGPTEVKAQHTVKLAVKDAPAKAKPKWYVVPLDDQDANEIEWISASKGLEIRWIGPVGKYQVTAKWGFVDKDGSIEFDEVTKQVVVGWSTPPQPPGPGPGPGPSPSPVVAGNLRVLMLFESGDATKLPRGQQMVLYGKTVRDYLNAKCVKEGKQPAYRIWDQDTDATAAGEAWAKLMEKYNKSEKKELPYIVIQNDKAYYEGPLPENVEKTMELLKKYGGE